MDIVERLRGGKSAGGYWREKEAADEIERLREVNITQAKWLYDEQQAHKALRDKVRQLLGGDKFDILKENE